MKIEMSTTWVGDAVEGFDIYVLFLSFLLLFVLNNKFIVKFIYACIYTVTHTIFKA